MLLFIASFRYNGWRNVALIAREDYKESLHFEQCENTQFNFLKGQKVRFYKDFILSVIKLPHNRFKSTEST